MIDQRVVMMLTRFIILSFLFSGVLEAKEIIVDIGGIVKLLNKGTSCERSLWGNSDENACRCCITKHHEQNPTKPQDSFAYCESKTYCDDAAVKNIAVKLEIASSPVDPETFVKAVSDSANVIRTVALNENELKQPDTPAGELSAKTAIYFLQVAAQKEIIKGDYAYALKKGTECLTVKKRNGGAQTLQLFSITLKSECTMNQGDKTIYILKEMKKPVEEVINLAKIKNSDLKRYLPKNNPKGIVIALAQQNLEYSFQGRSHFMSLLPTAAGKSMNDYLENYLEAKKQKAENLDKMKNDLKKASCGAGKEIAVFHEENMEPKKAIFGLTRVHGDLHLDNFFVDLQADGKIIVTLIDDETMEASINSRQSIGQDLIRVVAHATSRFLGKSALYESFQPVEYDEIFLKPLLECYAKAYPSEKLTQVKRELKKILTAPGTFNLLISQKVLYNPFAWSSIQSDVNAIIDAIQ